MVEHTLYITAVVAAIGLLMVASWIQLACIIHHGCGSSHWSTNGCILDTVSMYYTSRLW